MNDSFQCASPIPVGSQDSDELSFNGAELFYAVDVENTGQLRFTLDPMPNARQVRVEVYDAEYQEIAERLFKPGQRGSFEVNFRAPGRYYAKLASWGPGRGPGDYTFAVTDETHGLLARPGQGATCTQNGTFQCAAPLFIGERDSDVLDSSGAERFYLVDIEEPSEVKFTLDPVPNRRRVYATIHDTRYSEIAEHVFDPGEPGDFNVNFRNAGQYYVMLHAAGHGGNDPGSYTLTVAR